MPEAPAEASAPLALRVSFVGERARRWLSAWVEELPLGALDSDDPSRRPEALVVDAGEREAEDVAGSARARGTRVITLPADERETSDNGTGALAAVRPVDPRAVSPIGFRHSDVAGFACFSRFPRADLSAALRTLSEVVREEPATLIAPSGPDGPPGVLHIPLPDTEDALLRTLRTNLGTIDHPGLHGSDCHRATTLVRLCAGGIPVAGVEVTPGLERLLGPELAKALNGVHWRELTDLDRREQVSVRQRRAALRNHSLDARWRALCRAAEVELPPRPKVSAILSTRRQSWLAHGIEQFERQNYEPRELVACLHGDDFSDHVEDDLKRAVSHPLQVVRVRSELTLGDALNAGTEAASGKFVSKMDDDDYYSVDHLWDLMLAAEYSGADLIGKAAEFVYLEDIGLTIRRFMGDTERASERPLAGGGLMARREPLRRIGGWSSRSRGEDTALIKSFRDAGLPLHRTHGYGYILNRHGRDHTWNTYVDYFLVQSQREWRGLRFDEAGIY